MAKAAISVRLIGDKRLTRTLRRLPGKLQRKILRPALRAAASPIAKAAKRKAPKRSGQLKRSIGVRVVPQRLHRISGGLVVDVGPRPGFTTIINGQRHDPQKIAHLVEGGTENTKAQPFLRPAFDENVGKAKKIIVQRVRKGLAKAGLPG